MPDYDPTQEQFAGPYVRDDEEDLFSRDVDGQLVRLDKPTEDQARKTEIILIDGHEVEVNLALPLKDANGNKILDAKDRPVFRDTTIYDVALKHYLVDQKKSQAEIPIPILCHQPHLTPVAVCRLCVVQVCAMKENPAKPGEMKEKAERKLFAACQAPVKKGMMVFTMQAQNEHGERVRRAVETITELLAADHLKPAPAPAPAKELQPYNELQRMAERCRTSAALAGVQSAVRADGETPSHFRVEEFEQPVTDARPPKLVDASSPVFLVDHSACILCDRCIRACDDVKQNHVIGRTGKGARAGIGFDLNLPMADSSCVQCGECMISCPTSAITFKPVAQVTISRGAEVLPAAEIIADPHFAGAPPKFFLWQQGLALRHRMRAGDVLCRQGDAGNTAFIIQSGKLKVTAYPTAGATAAGRSGEVLRSSGKPLFDVTLDADNFICGEMACLSGSPRTADVTVAEAGEIWEVRRNVVDRLMRLPSQRLRIEKNFRERTLDQALHGADLFKQLERSVLDQVVKALRDKLSFVTVLAGQTLFRQGDPAGELYIIQLGHVRVGVALYGSEARVLTRAPGAILGEIGLLALSRNDLGKSVAAVDAALAQKIADAGDDLENAVPAGFRTATCTALEQVQLARVARKDFLPLLKDFPTLRHLLIAQSLQRLESDRQRSPFRQEFVGQGLYEGRSILVLDLDRCTRCDECTRGCIEQHGTASHGVGVTRLLRDGRRFGNFVVATSCRSCETPHCMTGCPVDSIHRGKHMQIVIEDHCIGCGLCANNCPYGSIFMVKNQGQANGLPAGQAALVGQDKAATCDLCDAHGDRAAPAPRCVAACPHDAAHRYTGKELLDHVLATE